jgi:membrane protein
MLLIWVFVSWIILLLGAEIAFAHQNLARFRLRQRWRAQPTGNMSYWGLQLLLFVGKRFETGKPPSTVMELAEKMQIPAEETREITDRLQNLGALKASGENGYEVLPAKDMKHLVVFDLVEGLEERESIEGASSASDFGKVILEVLNLIREQGRAGAEGLTVADLLAKAKVKSGLVKGETGKVSTGADEITEVVDEFREKIGETGKELDGDQLEK